MEIVQVVAACVQPDSETCGACGTALDASPRCDHCGAAAEAGGFRILRVLAERPHRRVYLAERDGRRVALKELSFSLVPGCKRWSSTAS